MKLAQECAKQCTFLHVSSSFVCCDRVGFIEERLYDSNVDWSDLYKKIRSMPQRNINEQTPAMLGKFPNTHTFSKRMAEELLLRANTTKMPLVFIRPSIMGSSANEPLPGWTDSVSLLQGVALLIGLGIMRDVPGNSSFMADIIPVDIVARQMLTALAYVDHNRLPLFISNSTSSSMNPTTWGTIFSSMV